MAKQINLLVLEGESLNIPVFSYIKGYKILEAPVTIRKSFDSTIKITDIVKMFYNVLDIWGRKKIKNIKKEVKWKQKIIKKYLVCG